MAVRVGTDHLDGVVTQVRGCPHRTMLAVYKVGAATRVADLACLFYVDDELRVRMGRHDGGNTRLRMVFLVAHGHATGAHDLLRLQGVAVHDHELGRPVGAGNGVLVFPALVLGGLDRTRFHTNLDLGYGLRLFHPQVDHVDQGVTADNHHVTARGRHPGDVHRVAGFDDLHDFLGIAVNQGNLTGVTQGNAEDVFQVQVVHLFLRTIFRGNNHFPGVLHVSQAELGRLWRLVHDVLGHQFHGFFV